MHILGKQVVPQDHIGIQWFGQNTFAIKDAQGTILMVDPYFPRERPASEFIHASPPLIESDLQVDLVLLTHDHGDHSCPETLGRIYASSPNAHFFGPEESIKRLREMGIGGDSLAVMTAGETKQFEKVIIHVVFSKPPFGIPDEGIPVPDVTHLGYVIEFGSIRVYISGDLIHSFASHEELLQTIRQLRPDIGFLTTHPTEGEFPDFYGSVEMAQKLGLKSAVPAHYDCFVKRTFDPQVWASIFPADNPQPLILPYNQYVLYPAV